MENRLSTPTIAKKSTSANWITKSNKCNCQIQSNHLIKSLGITSSQVWVATVEATKASTTTNRQSKTQLRKDKAEVWDKAHLKVHSIRWKLTKTKSLMRLLGGARCSENVDKTKTAKAVSAQLVVRASVPLKTCHLNKLDRWWRPSKCQSLRS